MKGVIAGRTDALVSDLSHDIAPYDVWGAAFFLRDVVEYWPAQTIFVVVVDPGVGTERRIVAIRDRGRVFVAPDNGVLHFIDGDARSVENESLFLPGGSTTFHGRDRFAPVVAAIANGMAVEEVGPRLDDRVTLEYSKPDKKRGTIVRIDRFGNAITDIKRATVLQVHEKVISRWSKTYSGEGPFLVMGSSGCIEISVAQADAAALLQLRRGDRVEICDDGN